mmetsp:Transcript_39523/g.113741  ORF Transcript_39523/g.113741 Transcript_39523/m.113741 type:complete len:232 (-) Transcript_39523:125-820(-)
MTSWLVFPEAPRMRAAVANPVRLGAKSSSASISASPWLCVEAGSQPQHSGPPSCPLHASSSGALSGAGTMRIVAEDDAVLHRCDNLPETRRVKVKPSSSKMACDTRVCTDSAVTGAGRTRLWDRDSDLATGRTSMAITSPPAADSDTERLRCGVSDEPRRLFEGLRSLGSEEAKDRFGRRQRCTSGVSGWRKTTAVETASTSAGRNCSKASATACCTAEARAPVIAHLGQP